MTPVDPLTAARLPLPGPDFRPEVYAEAQLVARRLRLAGRRSVGLQPAAAEVTVLPVALLLASAFAEQSGAGAVVVAPRVAWPTPPEGCEDEDGDRVFARLRVREGVVLRVPRAALGTAPAAGPPTVIPPTADRATVSFGDVDRVLRRSAETAGLVLVDLTAYRELASLVEGVAILARAGRDRERRLLRLHHDLPAGLALGVVLLGGIPA